MNNPFFDQARDGCKQAEKELDGAIECLYIGPGEHGGGEEQVQVVNDLIARRVDGIAVSPSNAPAMGRALIEAQKAGIPVLTWDSDLLERDEKLRIAYVGTNNYEIGRQPAIQVETIKPKGGTICIQSGGAAAANHNERMQGLRDTLSGEPSKTPPGKRLTGQNSWTEVDGCPLYTNDDFPVAVQQMEDILGKYPQLDAFVPTGGFPQFLPQAYRKVAEKVQGASRERIAGAGRRGHAAGADRFAEGRAVRRPGGAAAVRDGLPDDVLPEGHQGRQGEAGGSDLHRSGCLHAEECGDVCGGLTTSHLVVMAGLDPAILAPLVERGWPGQARP